MTTLETLLTDPETTGPWALQPDSSTIDFRIKNMWGVWPVTGKFTQFSGGGTVDAGTVSGRIEIAVESLDTGIGRRDRHLRSDDFFDAERFPQITVVVTGLEPGTGKDADLRTDFTIKGRTQPVPLPVTVTELADGSVRVSTKAEIRRSQFDLDWNTLGMVSDTVTVSADAVFVRSADRA